MAPNHHAHAASTSTEWTDRLHGLLGIPPTDGNEVRILRNGDQVFPEMLGAIDAAEHTVDLVTFVYWTGDIAVRTAETLAAAGRRGVRVRVLLDAVGARKVDDELVAAMRDAGVDVRWFRPINDGEPAIGDVNHRTHRKLLICDGTIGFTGGIGIAAEWTGDARDETEWRDTHVAVRGPAVAGLAAAFLDNWADTGPDAFEATAEPLIDLTTHGSSTCFVHQGEAQVGASDLRRLLLAMVELAHTRLRIASAYFNPDDVIVARIRDAARRGVEVQILLPGEHADKRFVQLNGEGDYQALLDVGVDLRTYERTMMHAKIVTVDGVVASIGSANLNERSLQLDEECNLTVVDPDVVAVLDAHFDDDLEASVVLDPERWADRSVLQRAGEAVTAAFERWL